MHIVCYCAGGTGFDWINPFFRAIYFFFWLSFLFRIGFVIS